jgi:hypothetical protein
MTATTLGGRDMGKVQSFGWELNANVIPMNYPGRGSNLTETFDLLGLTRLLNVDTLFTGTTATILTALNLLEAFIDGDQVSHSFSTPFLSVPINVKIMSMSTTWEVDGIGNRCTVRFQLIEGL